MFIPSHPVLQANFLKYLDLICFVTINYDYRNHISLRQHSMPVLLKIFSGLYVILCDHIFLIKHYSKKNKTQQFTEPHWAAPRCGVQQKLRLRESCRSRAGSSLWTTAKPSCSSPRIPFPLPLSWLDPSHNPTQDTPAPEAFWEQCCSSLG